MASGDKKMEIYQTQQADLPFLRYLCVHPQSYLQFAYWYGHSWQHCLLAKKNVLEAVKWIKTLCHKVMPNSIVKNSTSAKDVPKNSKTETTQLENSIKWKM